MKKSKCLDRGSNLARLNTAAYNKIIVDVYHMSFITASIVLNLLCLYVKRDTRMNGVGGYPYLLLYFVDLAARILLSVVLPAAVHIHNPEIKKYVRQIFR